MVITKEDLYDRLVNQAGFDKDEVDSFFTVYSLKDWLSAINAGDLTVYRLEQKIDEWLNYENPMEESTTLTEGWTSAYEWQSVDDVRDALKEEEISSDWKFVKNFGNFFCYQRKDGRPLVCYYLIQKMGGREWGYKDIGVYPGMKYNASAAAWLKNALIEYGSTAIEPGDFKGYWDWIEEGNTNKDKVSDMKSQLKAGDKVEIRGNIIIFERPYNKQAFAGHVEDEDKTYKWYYRDIEKVLTENMRENMDLQEAIEFLNNQGYYLKEAKRTPLTELSDEDIEEAKELLMDEYGYPYDSVEAAFEYQHAWISDVKMGSTPGEIAAVVSDFLDSLSDEELDEIGA
jgi:hypothetical protein